MKIGVDIGGTKCAVVLGDEPRVIEKIRFETTDRDSTISKIIDAVEQISQIGKGDAIGISCGGPLDEKKGLILSPPNLPEWDGVPITDMLSQRFGVPAYLCNDANACALAEWKYGAGRGTQNMVFMTFGTGLGAGLILDGKLYSGTNGMAGEVGHVRLAKHGPVGYGKQGSFEGFCSGGGLAQIGKTLAMESLQMGKPVSFCHSLSELDGINAKVLADCAEAGDALAIEAYRLCGEMLGYGVSLLIDILNPEAVVIGSIFQRSENLLRPEMERVIAKEALSLSSSVCRVVPAELGNSIGDYAALSVAYEMSK